MKILVLIYLIIDIICRSYTNIKYTISQFKTKDSILGYVIGNIIFIFLNIMAIYYFITYVLGV